MDKIFIMKLIKDIPLIDRMSYILITAKTKEEALIKINNTYNTNFKINQFNNDYFYELNFDETGVHKINPR